MLNHAPHTLKLIRNSEHYLKYFLGKLTFFDHSIDTLCEINSVWVCAQIYCAVTGKVYCDFCAKEEYVVRQMSFSSFVSV